MQLFYFFKYFYLFSKILKQIIFGDRIFSNVKTTFISMLEGLTADC